MHTLKYSTSAILIKIVSKTLSTWLITKGTIRLSNPHYGGGPQEDSNSWSPFCDARTQAASYPLQVEGSTWAFNLWVLSWFECSFMLICAGIVFTRLVRMTGKWKESERKSDYLPFLFVWFAGKCFHNFPTTISQENVSCKMQTHIRNSRKIKLNQR